MKLKIIVDKMPECCEDCVLYDSEYYTCWGTGTYKKVPYELLSVTRPDWCPLEEREHILSKDCWCNPTVEDYRKDNNARLNR